MDVDIKPVGDEMEITQATVNVGETLVGHVQLEQDKQIPSVDTSPRDVQIGKGFKLTQSKDVVAKSSYLGGHMNPTVKLFRIQHLCNDQVLDDNINIQSQNTTNPFFKISPTTASCSNLLPGLQTGHGRTHRPILPPYCKPLICASAQKEDCDVKINKHVKKRTKFLKREKEDLSTLQSSPTGKISKGRYSNCTRIGLDFNVQSGPKQKLDVHLLTNGVIIEVSDFAKEVNRAQRHVICDILEYNFDLGLQQHQRYDFATHTLHTLKELMRKVKSARETSEMEMEVFTLPDPHTINGLRYAVSTANNYDTMSKLPGSNDMLSADKCDLDTGSRLNRNVGIDNQLSKTNKVHSAGGAVYGLARNQSWHLMASKKMKGTFPLCKKIGLDLNVKSRCGAKEKLDLNVLTKGVMIELGNFAKEMCGTYKKIVLDILEHNFDLDLPIKKTELSKYIIANLRLVVKKVMCMANNKKPHFLKKIFSLGFGTIKRPGVITTEEPVTNSKNATDRKDQGQKEVTDRRQFVFKRKIGECATEGGIKADISHEPKQLGQYSPSGKKRNISNETELALSADTTNVLLRNLKDAKAMPFAETRMKDCFPLCNEIGLELDVNSKPPAKKKINLQLLTNGIMYEIHKFARKTKKPYMNTVYDILEYNVDVDWQNMKHPRLALHISSKLKRMSKHLVNGEFSKEVFIIPFVTKQYKKNKTIDPPERLSTRQMDSKRTQELSDTEDNFIYPKIVSYQSLVADEKTLRFLYPKETISIQIDETMRLDPDNRPTHFCLKEFNLHTCDIAQSQCPENNQLHMCRKIINSFLLSHEMQQMRGVFVAFSNGFGVGTGTEKTLGQILADYRSDILPQIVEKQGGFGAAEKTMISLLNQLFCGLHLIDCLGHQAKTTLLLWENSVLRGKENGAESSSYIESAVLESGTERLVNTVSNAVQELGWAEDGQLVTFEVFLTNKREFDELPLCLSTGHKIDGLFYNSAGVYSIHDDLVEFTCKYGAESSLLTSVVADLEVPQLKAGCRAVGLISKLIIDPLWRALTLKENVLEMEGKYQRLVNKLKDWQGDSRDLVGGNASLFDDIEVPKDLVFDRLTMWTDTDFFELTVEIVEFLVASFLNICSLIHPVDLDSRSNIKDQFTNDLSIIDKLQKAKANAAIIAVEGMVMCKKNHSWEWLS